MAKQLVNIGTSPNDGTGDPLRDAFDKINDNFNELYQGLGDGSSLGLALDSDGNIDASNNVTIAGDLTVSGTYFTVNTETVEFEDNILNLNRTQGSPDTATATTSGISIYRGDGVTEASFIFDDADDTWNLTNSLVVANTLQATTLTDGTATLTGGILSNVTFADGVTAVTQATSDNSTKIATTAYVKSVVTLEDLDFAGDSGTGSVDLDSQSLIISGTTNEIETSASGQTITIGLPNNVVITGDLTVDTNTLYVDSANNRVGIGLPGLNPGNALQVRSDSGDVASFVSVNTNGAKINLENIGVDSFGIGMPSESGDLAFYSSNTTERMRIKSGGDISFRDTSDNEAFYWDASEARLGINAPTVDKALHIIKNGGAAAIKLERGDATASGTYGQIGFSSVNGIVTGIDSISDGDSNGGHLRFFTTTTTPQNDVFNLSVRMLIDSSGRVGINQTSPSSFFSNASQLVIGDGSTSRGMTIYGSSAGDSQIFFADGTTEDEQYRGIFRYEHSSDSMVMFTSAAERVRIDSSGVTKFIPTKAYGDTSSSVKIFGTFTGTNYSDGSHFNLVFGDDDSLNGYFGSITVEQLDASTTTASEMRFYTNAGGGNAAVLPRMTIDSSGRVGIGMTPSNYSGYPLQLNGGTQCFMSFGNSTTGTGAENGLVVGNDSTGADIYQREAQPLRFHTDNIERLSITSGGAIHLSQGTGNSYIGTSAGNLGTSTGTYNTGFGSNSLASLTSGNYNTAIGQESLLYNTTGSYNTAAGRDALALNTTGSFNTATGYGAMLANTTGNENTAVGYLSLTANTTGGYNTAVGLNSLRSNSTGNYNVAIGLNALRNNTTGNYNTANGTAALNANTTGYNNAAFGGDTLLNNTTGYQNTAIGTSASAYNTTGYQNTALGASALAYNTTGTNNVAIGTFALYSNTTGYQNTCNGYAALYLNTTGYQNTGNGYAALNANTTGFSNTANGFAALFYNTTGYYNTANGYNSLYYNTTGYINTANGISSLYYNTTGNSNTALGVQGLLYNTTGTQNTSIGLNSGLNITTGSNNSFLGYNAQASSATVSNEITLGDANVTSLRCNTQTISSLSDARDKTNIEDLPLGLDFVDSLRPVKFDWDRRDGTMSGVKDAGFIAQELDEAQSQYGCEDYLGLVYKSNPEKLEASYGKLVPVLVKAIQELKAEVESLKQQIS